jgi:hypothetical protein
MRPPSSYKKLPKEVRCRCLNEWRDADGSYWCCQRDPKEVVMTVNHRNNVHERLAKLGEVFKERNGAYGDTFRTFGLIMQGLFPQGLTVKTVEDWNRLALLMHSLDKHARYATNFSRGGHRDSLDDISVYAQILQMIDGEQAGQSQADSRVQP